MSLCEESHPALVTLSHPMFVTLRTVACFCPWGSPGMNTGVGSRFFLQIFPIQGSNLRLLHCKQILYYLSQQGSP